ncbi:nuclear receptor subfamily 1 group I member 3 isoform X3 [Rattus norvegicus]|eukprot:XP_017454417.1 PREDICTED: nuclear receptor subfamily 1 group I member 3 isoform X2 [Rattus norvegicus]
MVLGIWCRAVYGRKRREPCGPELTLNSSHIQETMTATLTLETMTSEEEYGPRNCVVCGDRATGYHFHALTCEGCKGFFRRTVSKTIGPICPFAGRCEVSKAQRRHCPACRLQKCLNVGMRKDMILSAEALALRRARQARRRAQKASLQLSQQQKELIQTLLGAHTRHVGPMFDQFVQFRPPAYLFSHHRPFQPLAPVLPLLTHFADINTFMVQQIIKFTKDLPLFRSLTMEDQISLLKGAAVEILHISLNTTFCLQTQNFFCGPLCYKMEDAVHGFQYEFLELIIHFHKTLKRLQLQEPEYALMAAMALFSPDRPGVTQREEIDQLQEEVALILNNHIMEQQSRLQSRFLYAKLMGLLAELRSINSAYSYEIHRIQGLSAMMPLLGEICS